MGLTVGTCGSDAKLDADRVAHALADALADATSRSRNERQRLGRFGLDRLA
jgi:2C-methyl-D-erythritol 2,4-cyclodiphosphate synthase